jgi:hypothetical protein
MLKKKHHTPVQIIHLLRQAEVETAGGQPLTQVCRKLGVSEQTYCRIAPGCPSRVGSDTGTT